MSYKGQVQVHGDTKWVDNGLRFATHQEADDYVVYLFVRWTQVANVQVVESDDPVNYRFDQGQAVRITAEEVAK